MSFAFYIGTHDNHTHASHRKAVIQWMAANVGPRGSAWRIDKPRSNGLVVRVTVYQKDSAALVTLYYHEHLVSLNRVPREYRNVGDK
jgi:hypothetical protein